MTDERTATGIDPVSTLVVGMGKTGLSCARFLLRQGVPVAVTDSREDPPGLSALLREYPQVMVAVGGFDESLFDWAQRLLVSPGVALQTPLIAAAQNRGVEVMGDVELFARLAQAPILAITGSNGKSTVTTLLGEMIRDAGHKVLVGGNIGLPVLDLLEMPVPDFYVLELSSFQLETTCSLDAVAAVVLNISADHMDRYDDVDLYAAAKQMIYHGQGVPVINRDDARVLAMMDADKKPVSFGLGAPELNDYGRRTKEAVLWLARGADCLMPVGELGMAGEHNQSNALASLALGSVIDLPMPSMLQTLRRFRGLPHRTQWVAQIDGVNWYNDSKGTNVGATVSAIRGLSEPLVLIAGGQGKGADFSELAPAVVGKVRAAILIGQDAHAIESAIADETTVLFARDMSDAVLMAQAVAEAGDAVLLSPACASFDMFNGYEHRGEVFMAAVQALAAGEMA